MLEYVFSNISDNLILVLLVGCKTAKRKIEDIYSITRISELCCKELCYCALHTQRFSKVKGLGITLVEKFPHFQVLARVLHSNFLHKEIQSKGGAYGGRATSGSGLFNFYSYRLKLTHLKQNSNSYFDSEIQKWRKH